MQTKLKFLQKFKKIGAKLLIIDEKLGKPKRLKKSDVKITKMGNFKMF